MLFDIDKQTIRDLNLFRDLLNIVYKIDVLQTLARIMKTDGFTLPEYCAGSQPVFEVMDAFYPILSVPVPNSFTFKPETSLCLPIRKETAF